MFYTIKPARFLLRYTLNRLYSDYDRWGSFTHGSATLYASGEHVQDDFTNERFVPVHISLSRHVFNQLNLTP